MKIEDMNADDISHAIGARLCGISIGTSGSGHFWLKADDELPEGITLPSKSHYSEIAAWMSDCPKFSTNMDAAKSMILALVRKGVQLTIMMNPGQDPILCEAEFDGEAGRAEHASESLPLAIATAALKYLTLGEPGEIEAIEKAVPEGDEGPKELPYQPEGLDGAGFGIASQTGAETQDEVPPIEHAGTPLIIRPDPAPSPKTEPEKPEPEKVEAAEKEEVVPPPMAESPDDGQIRPGKVVGRPRKSS